MASSASVTPVALRGGGEDGVLLRSPSGRIAATVAPFDGGAVSSLMVAGRGELLYRANAFEPPAAGEWSGRMPLLWPCVGRNFTPERLATGATDCCFERDGRVYDLPIHGFARHREWVQVRDAADAASASVTLALSDDAASRAVYPWPFALELTHTVTDQALTSIVTIRSEVDLPFTIGNHITLTLPAGPTYGDVVMATNATAAHELIKPGFVTGQTHPVALSDGVRLSDHAWRDTVLGEIQGAPCMSVTWPDGFRVTVSQSVGAGAEFVPPECLLFVMYGNPERAYYCPEPWIGWPNALQTGRGLINLPAGQPFEWTMTVDLGSA